MRLRAALTLGWLVLSLSCQGKPKEPSLAPSATVAATPSASGEGWPEVVSRVEKLQEEEGDVLARREELTRAREQVTAQRAALEAKKKQLVAAGSDLHAVDDEEKA